MDVVKQLLQSPYVARAVEAVTCRCTTNALAVVGALVAACWLLKTLGWVYRTFLQSGINLSKYRGQWAVVTGASWGLGEGFVRELARKGLNVVMIARSEDRLKEIRGELEQKHSGIQVQTVPFDFEKATDAQWAALTKQLNALNPAVLVNNVGVNVDYPMFFHESEAADKMQAMVTVNITATNRMTYALLGGMIQRKKGVVLFLSSGSALIPTPLLSVYAATKAYNNHLACSLNEELRGTGVWAQAFTPFFVTSKMSKVRRASLMIPSNLSWARKALASVGKAASTNPHWVHRVIASLMLSLPTFLRQKLMWAEQTGIRKRALKKRNEAQKTK